MFATARNVVGPQSVWLMSGRNLSFYAQINVSGDFTEVMVILNNYDSYYGPCFVI